VKGINRLESLAQSNQERSTIQGFIDIYAVLAVSGTTPAGTVKAFLWRLWIRPTVVSKSQ